VDRREAGRTSQTITLTHQITPTRRPDSAWRGNLVGQGDHPGAARHVTPSQPKERSTQGDGVARHAGRVESHRHTEDGGSPADASAPTPPWDPFLGFVGDDRFLVNGNGTSDVVVRDLSNPIGRASTKMRVPNRYVEDKINSREWM